MVIGKNVQISRPLYHLFEWRVELRGDDQPAFDPTQTYQISDANARSVVLTTTVSPKNISRPGPIRADVSMGDYEDVVQ
jgi:hypothetical protein